MQNCLFCIVLGNLPKAIITHEDEIKEQSFKGKKVNNTALILQKIIKIEITSSRTNKKMEQDCETQS